jgi:L-threonine kinase
MLDRAGVGLHGNRVCLRGNIPQGKGLSSSSTDILSVLAAVNAFLDAGLPAEELYTIASRVEPTDPCLSAEIVLFYQRSGVIGQPITLPPMSLLYFDADPDGGIDTQSVQRDWTPGLGKYFDWLLGKFLAAAEARDHDALFDCITASAEYNQTVVTLPRFEEYVRLARETTSGLMVAHSGTIAGLLTPPERAASIHARLEAMTGSPVWVEQYPPAIKTTAGSGQTFLRT